MKKKIITAISAIALLAVAIFGCYSSHSYLETIEKNWGIALPEEAVLNEIYSKQTEPTFNGDGVRYHVFSCENAEEIEKIFQWESTQKATIFADSFESAAMYWLDEIGVPAEERPSFENCRYYYQSQNDNSEIVIFWDSGLNRLYVAESFL